MHNEFWSENIEEKVVVGGRWAGFRQVLMYEEPFAMYYSRRYYLARVGQRAKR